jgi:hypothetical protein
MNENQRFKINLIVAIISLIFSIIVLIINLNQ